MNSWFPGPTNLTAADFAVTAALLGAMVAVGLRAGRRQQTTGDFFLGGRRVPWWAACLSFVATEVSAVTIISVPAVAFKENLEYLQFFIGSAAARLIIAYLFIPAFYKFDCTTIYQFLGFRFGAATQAAGSAFFFVTRLLGSGVRLMAACLAFSVLLGWNVAPAILLFTGIGIAYIAFGGIKAVVWTNVVQGLAILAAGTATLLFLGSRIDGGPAAAIEAARAAGRLAVFDWGPPSSDPGFWKSFLTNPNILWLAVLNGLFGSLAAFGTDHDLMQRLLTVETRGESQRTMTRTIPLSLLVLVIHLAIGTGLYAFYAQNPGLALPEKLDAIFPHFVGQVMPEMLRGLVLAAIVLASIDSPLASLSASFVTDLYRPFRKWRGLPERDERHYLKVSRAGVAVFGVALAALAYGFSHFQDILWLAFKIGGVTFGSLLGVFLLGLLTKRRANLGNMAAMAISAAIMLALLVSSEKGLIALGWSWLVIFGTLTTFGLGWAFGRSSGEEKT